MSELFLKDYIKSYPDFPKKRYPISRPFTNITETRAFFNKLINEMSNSKFFSEADAIIGVDARGFIFSAPLALKLDLPLILARKSGKLPGKVIEKSYNLEYGTNSLSLQLDSLKDYKNFVIVDDLLATGGTINCIKDMITELDKKIVGISVVAELTSLKARSLLGLSVTSQVSFD